MGRGCVFGLMWRERYGGSEVQVRDVMRKIKIQTREIED